MKKAYFFIFFISFLNFLFLGLSGNQILDNGENNDIVSIIKTNSSFNHLVFKNKSTAEAKINIFEAIEATDNIFNNLKLKLSKVSVYTFSKKHSLSSNQKSTIIPTYSELDRYLKLQVLRI